MSGSSTIPWARRRYRNTTDKVRPPSGENSVWRGHGRRKRRPRAFNDEIALRIRPALGRKKSITEKKVFGGIVFFLNGNMLVGGRKDSLIVRLGDEQGREALLEPHVRVFDITRRAMKNWVQVEREGIGDDGRLTDWIQRPVKFVRTLPAN